MEKALQTMIEEMPEQGQVTRDRAGYLILENIDRLPSASQRSIVNFLRRNNPNASRKLRGMLEGMDQEMKLKEKEELLELSTYEDTVEGQEEIIMKAVGDDYLTERMQETLRNKKNLGEPSQKFTDFVYARGFDLDSSALLLGKPAKDCAEPWLRAEIAHELTLDSKKSELADEAGIDFDFPYGIGLAIDRVLEAGIEKSAVSDIIFASLYPATPDNFRLRSSFLRWAQENGEKDLVYEICAIDSEVKPQVQENEKRLEFMRRVYEHSEEDRRKHEEESGRLRKVVKENTDGLASPNNPFAEQLKGFKPK
ncbi:MAG: hypothetical protein PHW33_04635 [Candidatus Portnoybacteria bacterium]|nr:hypothetical protein [Candidatus Portnoybacteria bacterium]